MSSKLHNAAEESLVLAQLAEHTANLLTLTQTVERLTTGIVNHTLFAGTVELDANGQYPFIWGATCGSVDIWNASETNSIVVTSSVLGSSGRVGPGVHYVPPGSWRNLAIGTRFLSLYGVAGDLVGVQAWTGQAGGGGGGL
jgi:hypothetical protein